ncbi:MAG: DUF4344 domain-containing metallopeptidase [Hyphomicrobiaceae bacterium]
MRCIRALAFLSIVSHAMSAMAQTDAPPELALNPKVELAYGEPANPAFKPIRDRLVAAKALEQLASLLGPLDLPRPLKVQVVQCDAPVRPYATATGVTICYEQIARIEEIALKAPRNSAATPPQMAVAAFVQTLLHETAHAIIDIYKLPVWGRANDAADRLAALMMLQFGPEIALKVVYGAAGFFEASEQTWTGSDFARAASPEAQRYYNYLCMAYGWNADTFRGVVAQGLLPEYRAYRCANEYQQALAAFKTTIMPHVDPSKLDKVYVSIPEITLP